MLIAIRTLLTTSTSTTLMMVLPSRRIWLRLIRQVLLMLSRLMLLTRMLMAIMSMVTCLMLGILQRVTTQQQCNSLLLMIRDLELLPKSRLSAQWIMSRRIRRQLRQVLTQLTMNISLPRKLPLPTLMIWPPTTGISV